MKKNGLSFRFLLVLLTVYFSCNSFILAIKYSNRASLIMTLVTMVIFAIALCKRKNRVPYQPVFLMVLGACNLLLTSVANGYTNAYLLIILNFMLAYAYICLFTRQEFFENYISAMKFFAVCAIAVGLINTVIPQLLSGVNVYYGPTGNRYYDVFVAFQNVESSRINSIWGEPGMFSVFLVFALIMECFYVKREMKQSNYLVFVSGIIFSFSTTGYTVLAIVLVSLLLQKNQSRQKVRIWVATLLILVGGLFAYSYVPWFREQFLRMSGKLNEEDISFVGRTAPIFYNLKEGIRSPLWGHGLKGEKFYVEFFSYSGYLFCNTSTTTFLFSSFGIILSGITVYLTARFVNMDKQNSRLIRILLFTAIMLNVNTQAIHLDQMYWLLLFSPFMKASENKDWRNI